MSYTKLIYHIVFRTKYSVKAINKDNERDLYAYIYGIATNYDAYVYRIGGMPDHIHILITILDNGCPEVGAHSRPTPSR